MSLVVPQRLLPLHLSLHLQPLMPVKKQCIHQPNFPLIPKDFSSFKTTPKSTLLKALAKSRYTMFTSSPLSSPLSILSKCDSNWLNVVRPLRKPCWESFGFPVFFLQVLDDLFSYKFLKDLDNMWDECYWYIVFGFSFTTFFVYWSHIFVFLTLN